MNNTEHEMLKYTMNQIDLKSIRFADLGYNGLRSDWVKSWVLDHIVKRIEDKMSLILAWKKFIKTGNFDENNWNSILGEFRGEGFGRKVGYLDDFLYKEHAKHNIGMHYIEDEDGNPDNFTRDEAYYFFGALRLIHSIRNQFSHGFNDETGHFGASLLMAPEKLTIGNEWFKPNTTYWKRRNEQQYMYGKINSKNVDRINDEHPELGCYDTIHMAKDQVIKDTSGDYRLTFSVDSREKDLLDFIGKVENYAMMVDVYLLPMIAKNFTHGLKLVKGNKVKEHVHISDYDELGQFVDKYSGEYECRYAGNNLPKTFSSHVWVDPMDSNMLVYSRINNGKISIYRDTFENLAERTKEIGINGKPLGEWVDEFAKTLK